MKKFVIKENLNFEEFKQKKVNLCIGTFDALHKGHIKILKALIKDSKKEKVLPSVLTFKNRPRHIITGENDGILMPNPKRIHIFKEIGIELLIFINFTKRFSAISPEDFIKRLSRLFIINKIIVGEDFRFGKDNKGDINLLKILSKSYNFKLKIIKNLLYINRKISTTMIKQYIKQGKIEITKELLGREYSISGKVIKGECLGSKVGFPTVNLKPEFSDQLLPSCGVYLTKIKIEDKIYYGLTYIGKKYVGRMKNRFVIETYIYEFNKNIYNKKIEIFFIKKLRKEKKFGNINDLKKQLIKDRIKGIMEVKNELDKGRKAGFD